jgi:succinate dehydrogenase hydrophobic anchor subunit
VSSLKIICCAIVGIVAAPIVVLLSVCIVALFLLVFCGTVAIHAATGVWVIDPKGFEMFIPNRD